jgi:hypothetical protein
MSNIQTNFRAEDMLGAKKEAVAKPVAPKKSAPKVEAPVVLEPVVLEPVVEETVVIVDEENSEVK